jgi:hypothetical protein
VPVVPLAVAVPPRLSRCGLNVEDELVNLGVDFTRGEIWKPYTVLDRNLYAGQNPASAAPLA